MQRLVKGATKPKVAAPKTKYIEPLIQATYDRGQELDQAMDALSRTLARSTNWTTTYKTLIVLHIMIREGQQDAVLRFISRKPRMIELDEDMARQAAGLGRYARYLAVRAAQFKDTKIDYIRYKKAGKTRLHNLSIAKGLLRECESVVVQIEALLKCKLEEQDIDNDVILMAFRLLVHDLLSLFQVLNEGVINLLEHFFELSRPDAEHALVVYKSFTSLTGSVISYLKTAKNLEYQTKLHVPNIKHAPTSLVSSLEIYLNDPDFEINRRQYVAEKQAHRTSRADLREKTQPQSTLNRQPTLVQQARRAEETGSTVNQVNAQLERQRSLQQAIQSSQPSVPLERQAIQSSQPSMPSQQQQQPYQPQLQREPSFDIFAADNSFASNAQQIQMQQAQSQMHTQQLAFNTQNLHQQTSDLQRQNTTGFNFGPIQQQQQQHTQQPQAPVQTIQPLSQQNSFQPQPTGAYANQHFQPVQASVQQTNQWNMPLQQQQQQLTGQFTGNQQTNPVNQVSSQHTGGFHFTQPVATQHTGGFGYAQPQPQAQAQPMQPMGTGQNPFRASMTGTSAAPTNAGRNSYNPFNRTMTGNQAPQQQQPLQQQLSQSTGMADLIQFNNSYQPQAAMASQHTATNPFHH